METLPTLSKLIQRLYSEKNICVRCEDNNARGTCDGNLIEMSVERQGIQILLPLLFLFSARSYNFIFQPQPRTEVSHASGDALNTALI